MTLAVVQALSSPQAWVPQPFTFFVKGAGFGPGRVKRQVGRRVGCHTCWVYVSGSSSHCFKLLFAPVSPISYSSPLRGQVPGEPAAPELQNRSKTGPPVTGATP